MKVLSVFGTRPEAIKMAPVVQALAATPGVTSQLCLTGQHSEMLDQVIALFDLKPNLDLAIMRDGQSLTHITTEVLQGVAQAISKLSPDWVLVHGDTTSSMAGALAAFYAGVPVGHVEAGLRTGDLRAPWPEEANRQITARLARLHFAPTESARLNLLAEAVPDDRIQITGNTVIDALFQTRDRITADAALEAEITARLPALDPAKRLILVTAHRRESFGQGLKDLAEALARLAGRDDTEILYPVHRNPEVRGAIEPRLAGVPGVHLVAPVSYLDFVWLMSRAALVITDSGGIQEEAPSLGKPVLVARAVTERPEAVDAGTVTLTGTNPDAIVATASELLDNPAAYEAMARAHNPYGDGRAAARIVARLTREGGLAPTQTQETTT